MSPSCKTPSLIALVLLSSAALAACGSTDRGSNPFNEGTTNGGTTPPTGSPDGGPLFPTGGDGSTPPATTGCAEAAKLVYVVSA